MNGRAPARRLAGLAFAALAAEALVTPKPGLVDRANSGAHRDMDLNLLLTSARSLRPFFLACAEAGRSGGPAAALFPRLKELGREAEKTMFAATGGVNTHKGAVFSLGLLAAASARAPVREWTAVQAEVRALCRGLVGRELAPLGPGAASAGERCYRAYGLTGARGQAEAGFPLIFNGAWPLLEKLTASGQPFGRAAMAVLIWLLTRAEDTNLVSRGGPEGLSFARKRAGELWASGEALRPEAVRRLDEEFRARNLSPGGCADLLAGACFLHFMRRAGLLAGSGDCQGD